jgi:glyoxylase-like metal-dependent hydrolase (beta-lactamase superfamily II)
VDGLRSIRADNPGPFTLDGTRTWILGTRRVAVIDPGPDVDDHVRAVVRSVGGADEVAIVLTHGHPDHSGGVDALLAALPGGLSIRVVGSGHPEAAPVGDGDQVSTDAGDLVCIPTPGHTSDHLAFHHPRAGTLFAGDLVLGEGDTTWVAEYPGCVADYLASLDRVAALELRMIHPTHGPVIRDPAALIARYRAHRESRIDAVRAVRVRVPGASFDEVYEEVYGAAVPARMRAAAEASLRVLLHHVDTAAARG